MQDWVVCVTGGASGLGKATVELLVQKGAKVCILDLSSSSGSSVVEELGEENVIFVESDVRSEEDLKKAFAECKKIFGKLNGLVNCAGICLLGRTYDKDLEKEHSLKLFTDIMDVNCTGTFNACRLAAAEMSNNSPCKDGQRGVIVNIASVSAYEGAASAVAYSTSKAAIVGMIMPMARDLAPIGVRVMAVAPGPCSTTLMQNLPQVARDACTRDSLFPKRMTRPEEVAEIITTILENRMLNGETIRLDGGFRVSAEL